MGNFKRRGPGASKMVPTFGWYPKDGSFIFMRSAWELNYARYLDFLVSIKHILSWEYEPVTFWFEGIRQGCVNYKPDFKVTNAKGGIEYHEVKGWMDDKSQTKLDRMKKFYPNVLIWLVDRKRYAAIAKQKDMIPNWGVWEKTKPDMPKKKATHQNVESANLSLF